MRKQPGRFLVFCLCLVCFTQAQEPGTSDIPAREFTGEQEGRRSYILIAAQEEAKPSIPCRFYQVAPPDSDLALIADIPAQQGIRLVETYPHRRKVAIWRAEDQDRGSLVIADVDLPEDRRTVALPFDPLMGGYLVQGPEETLFFAAWYMRRNRSYLYSYSVLLDRLDQVHDTYWETAALLGANALRNGGQVMDVMINIERGTFFGMFNRLGVDLPFLLDGETWRFYQQLKPSKTQIWANTEHVCVVGAQAFTTHPEQFFIFLLDKVSQTWKYLTIEGAASHIQIFDTWLLIQQAFQENENLADSLRLTGQYTFYNLDSHEQFVWQTDPHNEVLGIWEDSMLYRIGDELFEATITGTEVSDAHLLTKDQAIQDVHWAFIAP